MIWMSRRSLSTLPLLLGVCASGAARAEEPRPASDDSSGLLRTEQYILENGLRVVLHTDRRLPMIALDLTYHVGAMNDGAHGGLARMAAPLMFWGTNFVSAGDYHRHRTQMNAILDYAVSPGETSYRSIFPANQLTLALWLESDRMAHCRPSRQNFEIVRDGIIDGWKEGGLGCSLLANAMLAHALQPAESPAFEKLHVTQVRDFMRKYHGPANATLVLAGDLPNDAREQISRQFEHRVGGEQPRRPQAMRPKSVLGRKVVRWPSQRTGVAVALGWVTPGFGVPGDAEAHVLATSLVTERFSKLRENSAVDNFMSLVAHQMSFADMSAFMIIAEGARSVKQKQLVDTLNAFVDDLRAKPLSVEEVGRGRRRRTLENLRSLQGLNARAGQMQRHASCGGGADGFESDDARYAKVHEKAIAEFVGKYLTDDRCVVLVASED